MKLRDRVRQLAVLCPLLAASLAGCGGGSESSSASSSATPTTSSASSSAPTPAPTAPPPSTTADSSTDNSGGGESSSGTTGLSMGPNSTTQGMPGSGTTDSTSLGGAMGMGMGMGMTGPGSTSPTSGYPGMSGMAPPGTGTSTNMSSLMGTGAPGMGMGMGGMYGGQKAPVDPAPSEDEDYMTKAKYAFAIGKEAVAEQYFYAHLLAHEDEAAELLKDIRWSPGARKPTTTVRFAVGVDLKAPAGIDDVRPIGRSQMAGKSGAAGGSPMPSGYGMAPGTGQPGAQGEKAEKSFGDLTGKFGEELVTAFETAWDNGDFGTAFKDVEAIAPVKAAPTNNPYGMGMGTSGMDPSTMGSMMGYGSAGMPSAGSTGAAAADASARMKAVSGKAIVPGLLYLGTGSPAELEEKAQQEGIDYLFLFEVAVKQARGLVHNDTRLRLISTKDGSAVGATSTLNNLKVDRAMATKSDGDDLTKQLGTLFRKVETLKLTALPKLEPVHAQARIKGLIEKKPSTVLQTLMEIRLFNSMGLLDEEERNAAYQLAIGGGGVAFAGGSVEDRQTVLDPLLPSYK